MKTKDTRNRFTLRIPTGLMASILEMANQKGVSANAMILRVLWEWMEREERKGNE